jgi:multiple sugar transport system permease protein
VSQLATPVAPSSAPSARRRAWWESKLFRERSREVVLQLILITIGVTFVMPLYWMILTSIKPDTEIFVYPPVWWPSRFVVSNYPNGLTYVPFFLYMRNSVFYAGMAVIGVLLSNPLAAYSFSRLYWPGRDTLFIVTIATLMLPYTVTLIPVFVIYRHLGWVNTYLPLIVPTFLGSPFYIFLLRQFMLTIPRELSEAARMDGANEFGIYWRIILPLIRPALAAVALFEFIRAWKDFLGPLIYLNSDKLYVISVGLQQYKQEFNTQWAFLMAASTTATVPIILLFYLTQRTFIQGITLTGIKG